MEENSPMHTAPDKELLKRIIKRDSECFHILFSRYHSLICKVWHQFHINGLDLEDWEQEASLVLYKTVLLYRDREATFAWYYKLALTNRIRDIYRGQSAKKRIPLDLQDDLTKQHVDYLLVDINSSPEDISHYRQNYREFLQHCSELEYESFIRLTSGQKLDVIAIKLDSSPMAVRSAFARARRKFIQYVINR